MVIEINIPIGSFLLLGSLTLSFAFFIYGLNILHLTRRATKYTEPSRPLFIQRPCIAIHLPIYNELYVCTRLLQACISMAEHYGKEFVRIYIIDDSDDETSVKINQFVSKYRDRGFLIEIIRRSSREGFKAGALQTALERTNEDFIAVFDADFAPPPDFLDRTTPYLLNDSSVGFVQCRWSHFNREYNFITKTLAIGVDAHFLVEQPGRWYSDYMINFNGSAGLLRKEAIIKSGGWHSDTLAEDLDLSYRMQLSGYRAVYLKNFRAPSELPPTITSLKRQQGRWAKGSLQTARKLTGQILRTPSLSRTQKLEAVIHLTYYIVHPLMLASFLLASAAALLNIDVIKYAVDISLPKLNSIDELARGFTKENVTFFTVNVAPWLVFSLLVLLSTFSVPFYCIQAIRMEKLSLLHSIQHLILLVVLGYGMSISNSLHALSGLLSRKTGIFQRTPKYDIRNRNGKWRGKKYQIPLDKTAVLEGLAVMLALLAMVAAILSHNLGIIPILSVYLIGYTLVFTLTVIQSSHPHP